MSHFYLDTSALVKRYTPETGSTWVKALTNPMVGNTIVLSEITLAEIAAVFVANLTQNHRLRGYDSVQLATALFANQALIKIGLLPLTFVAADRDLLTAARAESLAIENPNLHP